MRIASNKLLMIAFLLFPGTCLSAQEKGVQFWGELYERDGEVVSDGYGTRVPVTGAIVMVVSERGDTLYTESGIEGNFYIGNIPPGKAIVKITHMSYKTKTDIIEFQGNTVTKCYLLDTDAQMLQSVRIKGETPVFSFSKDTLTYHIAATQQVSEDDRLKDVLERLPGIAIMGGKLQVMGEDVAKAYINNRLIFGDDLNAAMQYLAGSQILSIRVYDQSSLDAKLRKSKAGEKERVIDVKTKEHLDYVAVVSANAAFGQNITEVLPGTKNRYAAGLTTNYFSESLQLSGNALINNIGRHSNESKLLTDIGSVANNYQRTGYAGAALSKTIGDPDMGHKFSVSYSYDDDRSISGTRIEMDYVPTDVFDKREYKKNSNNKSSSGIHYVKAMYSYPQSKWIPTTIIGYSHGNSDKTSGSFASDIIDGRLSCLSQSLFDSGIKDGLSIRSTKAYCITDKLDLLFDADFETLKENLSFNQRDSSINGIKTSHFEPGSSVLSNSGHLYLSLSGGKYEGWRWEINYDGTLSHDNNKQIKYLYDGSTEALDALTSSRFSALSQNHSFDCVLKYNSLLEFGLKGQLFRMDVEYHFPKSNQIHKQWVLPLPHFSINLMKGMQSRTAILAAISMTAPSVQQLNPAINNLNPLFLITGNNNLKPTANFFCILTGNYMLKSSSSISILSKYNYSKDAIVQNVGFSEGVTISTFGNVDGDMTFNSSVAYSTRIKNLKLNTTVTIAYDFKRTPSSVYGKEVIGFNHSPSIKIDLKSNWSKKFRQNLTYSLTDSFSSSSGFEDINYLRNCIKIESDNAISKRLFLNGNYNYVTLKPLSGSVQEVSSGSLNAVAGYKLFDGLLSLTLSCYDILGTTTGFNTKVLPYYSQTTFFPVFGRYWLVGIGFDFNSTDKHHKGAPIKSAFGRVGQRFEDVTAPLIF